MFVNPPHKFVCGESWTPSSMLHDDHRCAWVSLVHRIDDTTAYCGRLCIAHDNYGERVQFYVCFIASARYLASAFRVSGKRNANWLIFIVNNYFNLVRFIIFRGNRVSTLPEVDDLSKVAGARQMLAESPLDTVFKVSIIANLVESSQIEVGEVITTVDLACKIMVTLLKSSV